ncbi:DUF4794 domain-containing protein [Pseudomonas aeruginosa]|nr:DUF4794 domain-containing protein [Pseudomonas aeruginosa]
MKSFACVVLIAVVVAAEPPSFRQNYRFQRQEVEPQAPADAPYAPAGFRPAKPFNLPTRQEAAPPATS